MNENPYSPTVSSGTVQTNELLDPAKLRKIEAIIKDANQFWLAILMCFLCSGIGMLIIGPWYGVRLMQWKALGEEDPRLLSPDVPYGSMAQRFQAAKWKLIVGLAFGIGLALLMLSIVIAIGNLR